MSDEETIFSRWSRRKKLVAEEESADVVPDIEAVAEPEPETDEEEAELLKRLNLPAPESLGEGDDFSVFMKAGVPEFLRKRALRVLWRSNPVLANLDGLNDYDDDFRSPELTQKVLATAYKVGRGILRDKTEDEPLSDAEEGVAEPAPEAEIALPTPSRPIETNSLPEDDHLADADDADPMEAEVAAPRPRRMHFDT